MKKDETIAIGFCEKANISARMGGIGFAISMQMAMSKMCIVGGWIKMILRPKGKSVRFHYGKRNDKSRQICSIIS